MTPKEKALRHPDYEKAPMSRRVFMGRVSIAGAIAAGAGYIALAPDDAPLSRKDSNGLRSIVPPAPFRLDDYRVAKPAKLAQDIGVARGEPQRAGHYSISEKRALLKSAIDAIGGIEHYVKRGDIVLVKPNVAFDRSAVLGATSDPEFVGQLIDLLYRDARAAEVRVADNPIESPADCFRKTGIGAATETAGGLVYIPENRTVSMNHTFSVVNTPRATLLRDWPIFTRPFEGVNKVIGISPVKDHVLCQASIGIKNWMGMLGGQRNKFHDTIHEVISDLTLVFRPTLTIVDGTRVLAENGPTGGDVAYVRNGDVVAAGLDPVALDAWAFEHCLGRGRSYPRYLALAEEKGGGQMAWEDRISEVAAQSD